MIVRVSSTLLLAGLVLLGGGTRHAAGDPPPGDPTPLDVEQRKQDLVFRLEVERAIGAGARWLETLQASDGSFRLEGNVQQGPFPQSRHRFGETALVTLTLAHCGYGPEREVVANALRYLRKHWRSYTKGDFWPQASAYALSILVLALHELFAQEGDAASRGDEERYGRSARGERNPCDLPTWVRQVRDRILDWLLETRAAEGLFRYPGGLPGGPQPPGTPGPPNLPMRGPAFAGSEDLSNTQYVLLALWVGSRCGYALDADVLRSIARRLLEVQERDGPPVPRRPDPDPEAVKDWGRYAPPPERPTEARDRARGFGYTPGDPATGSMTAAGLSSLAALKAMLAEQDALDADLARELERGLWDAIAWLDRHFSVTQNPPRFGPLWHFYYLYGLERACVIAGKRFLGAHDWYREGAELLIRAQTPAGAWRPPSPIAGFGGPGPGAGQDTALLDTCFALLFLKRAAVEPRVPVLDGPVVTPR